MIINKKGSEIVIGDILAYMSQNTVKEFGPVQEIFRFGDALMFKVNDHNFRRHMMHDSVMVKR